MFVDPPADFLQWEKSSLGREEQLAWDVDRARNVPSARPAAPGCGILPGIAGVDELPVEIGVVQEAGKLLGRHAQPRPDSGREDRAGDRHVPRLDRPPLVDPSIPSTVEHPNPVVAVIARAHHKRVANCPPP